MTTLPPVTVDPEFRALIPLLRGDERAQLERSILTEGCRDALVTWEGILLDGHHRFDICTKHGTPFGTVSIELPDRRAAMAWIIRNQFGRRNLSPFQRSELALKLEPLIADQAKANLRTARPGVRGGSPLQKSAKAIDTRAEVAKLAGVSHDTISKAKVIVEKAPEAVKESLRQGTTTINAAYRAVSKPPVIARAKAIPKGKYRTIEADPPWALEAAERSTAHQHYPTMDLDAIKALGLQVLTRAADDCHLYLWAITPMLPEAFEVMTAWGFTYKTLITWAKPSIGTGHYYRGATEHVLFGVRGKLACLRADQPNWFEAPRGRHSEKPERFYEIAETMSPGPRLRLFARSEREGWASWINEPTGAVQP